MKTTPIFNAEPILEAEDVSFGFLDGIPVIQDIRIKIHRNERIAIVGPIIGVRHLYFIPAVAVFGALLMLFGDLVCRLAVAPQELPMGIVTAAIGGVFVLILVFRSPY